MGFYVLTRAILQPNPRKSFIGESNTHKCRHTHICVTLLPFRFSGSLSHVFLVIVCSYWRARCLTPVLLDFWAASGLAPQTDRDVVAWPSCDSLLNLPVDLCPTKMTPAHDLCKSPPTLGPTRQLRRKKALMQLCLASPSSPDNPVSSQNVQILRLSTWKNVGISQFSLDCEMSTFLSAHWFALACAHVT